MKKKNCQEEKKYFEDCLVNEKNKIKVFLIQRFESENYFKERNS